MKITLLSVNDLDVALLLNNEVVLAYDACCDNVSDHNAVITASEALSRILAVEVQHERITVDDAEWNWTDVLAARAVPASQEQGESKLATPSIPDSVTTKAVSCWKNYYTFNTRDIPKTHTIEIDDQRSVAGQVYVTAAAADNDENADLSVTVEVGENPLDASQQVAAAHIHLGDEELAFSLFKIGGRLLMRPEQGMTVTRHRQALPSQAAEDFFWIE